MKPIEQHKEKHLDPKISNISFDNSIGSIEIIDSNFNEKQSSIDSMLTSSQTNGAENFVPSHHLALITQPVLGARSRSRKKTTTTTNIIVETSNTPKDKVDSMTNSRRSSFNDSPPLIVPINRIDTSQYQKKTNLNSHHESSDSGIDLSISTNSSLPIQQYSQQHIQIHRPLSALNEDSNTDDVHHEQNQQEQINGTRLRFPPLNFPRNRSMEDILEHKNTQHHHQQQQHRSSSFSDERQQKLSIQQQQPKIKRASDGALIDFQDNGSSKSTEPYRRTNYHKNESSYSTVNQPHRSFHDLTNKNSNKISPPRNESNPSVTLNNLSTTQTITRKPNTSTLKPLRKKTKLNIIVEPSVSLTPSRLTIYDEQINAHTATNSSSSNQTTPRSIRPPPQHHQHHQQQQHHQHQQQQQQQQQQQIKSKTSTPLEQIRAHVNKSVVERQQPTTLVATNRRGLIQQMIPFDASPSKVNNLLLRHQIHQHQPTNIFHPNSNSQLSPTRQFKQTLPTLYNEETISNVEEEKRKQIKIKEQEEKKRFKQKDDYEYHKSNDIHHKGQTKTKHIQEPNPTKTLHRRIDPYEYYDAQIIYRDDNRQRRTIVHRNNERHDSGQSSSTISKTFDYKHINQRNVDPMNTNRSDRIDHKQQTQGSKQTRFISRNTTINNKSNQTNEINHQYGNDYPHNTQKQSLASLQTRQIKTNFQPYESSTSRNSSISTHIDQNRELNQWKNSKYVNNNNNFYQYNKTKSKPIRIEPIDNCKRERETSQCSNLSKTDSLQSKQKFNEKYSSGYFQVTSPTSWSVISEHQNNYQKTNTFHSQLSTSPDSQHESIDEHSNVPSRTYRLTPNNDDDDDDDEQQHEQEPIDGRYVLPSNNLQAPSIVNQSSYTSSHHTYPFTCTTDFDTSVPNLINDTSTTVQNKKHVSIGPDVYTLYDHDNQENRINQRKSPSPLIHLSSNQKFSTLKSPPPPAPPPTTTTKVKKSEELDEIQTNYDSDDGWSDDSAELLYVDERYAKEKRKMTPSSSSHLPSQQHYHYHVQQQNVLLQ